MVIGIIGSGMSGLIAGNMLARAGHEVTIFEKERELGGHMATRSVGNGSAVQLDYGITHFTVKSPGFR
ncbi:MAG: NAD(P)-binding protein, partial [Balneolaceae bacterium]|nr:NAD(P)-binding protein [Balneolaceae bacterium]